MLAAFSLSGTIFSPSFAVFVLEYGYFLSIGLVIYFLLRRRPRRSWLTLPEPAFRVLVVSFFLLVGTALLSVVGSLYERPLTYYLLSAAAITTLFAQVLGGGQDLGGRRGVILIEALLVPVANVVSMTHVQPYLFGADSTFHLSAAAGIATTGELPAMMGVYLSYPSFHILAAGTMLFAGTIEIAFVSATFLHSLLAVLASYLILRRMTSERTALLGSLFVLAAPMFMTGTLAYSPNKAGFALLLLAFWVAIRVSGDQRLWGIYFVLFVAAFLYHPIFGFLLVLVSLCGTVVSRSHVFARMVSSLRISRPRLESLHRGQEPRPVTTAIIAPFLFSIVAYVTYLTYVDVEVFGAILGALTFPDNQFPALGTILRVTPTLQFVAQSMLSSLGYTAMVALAVPVLVIWVRDTRNRARMLFALTYLVMLVSISLVVVSDLFLLGPARFLASLDFFVAISAGPGLVFVLTRIRFSRRHFVVVSALFFSLVMLSSLSYRVDGNSILSEEIPTGLGYLQEDSVAVARFLHPRLTEESLIFLDDYMVYWIANFPGRSPFTLYRNPVLPTNILNLNPDLDVSAGLYVVNARSAERSGWSLSDLEAKFALTPQVYDSGNVRILASS